MFSLNQIKLMLAALSRDCDIKHTFSKCAVYFVSTSCQINTLFRIAVSIFFVYYHTSPNVYISVVSEPQTGILAITCIMYWFTLAV